MCEVTPSGTITSVPGFHAGAAQSGIRAKNRLDLAILYSEVPCVAAGVFTTNQIKSSPVVLSREHLSRGQVQAVVANSGCANACVGEQGLADAREMAQLVAGKLGIRPNDVLVASTGVIGTRLPMDCVQIGIRDVELRANGGHDFARAIMTTDTNPKEVAVSVDVGGTKIAIAGVAKGSGMIHPDMATMLAFLATDASIHAGFLQAALKQAVDVSFHMISVDGETSPSDCVFLLANGRAGNDTIGFDNGGVFQQALSEVCLHLARSVARDGEGATKMIEVVVEGARQQSSARQAARTIVSSPLVKAAIHGSDPNWGRIVTALGRSGAEVMEEKLDVYLNDINVMKQGHVVPVGREKLQASLQNSTVSIRLHLNLGDGTATAWGCDLSEEYVTINSAYTT